MGDEYNDGHGKTAIINIDCSHSANLVIKGIADAKERLKVPRMCYDYEDSKADATCIERLIKEHGLSEDMFDGDENEGWYVDPDTWLEFHMWLAGIELEEFSYKIDNIPSIDLEGYGLFS